MISPQIFSTSKLQPGNPDYYQVCSETGVTFWTDSTWVSYSWSTGDTTDSTHIAWSSGLMQTVTLTVTDTGGNTGGDTIYVVADPWGTGNVVAVVCDPTFCASTGTDIIPSGNPFLDSIVWDNNVSCLYDPQFNPCNRTIYGAGPYSFENHNRTSGCVYTGNSTLLGLTPVGDPDTPLVMNMNDTLVSDTQPNYQWFNNGTLMPGDTNMYLVPTGPGNYTVRTYAIGYDCNGQDTCGFAESNSVLVGQVIICFGDEFEMWPNPINDQLHIRLPKQAESEVKLRLTDLSGRIVEELEYDDSNSMQLDLDVNVDSGLYIIQLEFDGELIQQKLIVDRK